VKNTTKCGRSGGALDPSQNATFVVLDKLLSHVSRLFPDQCLHIGGDEFDLDCWLSDPALVKWLQDRHPGMTSTQASETEAYGNFIATMNGLLNRYGKTSVHWEDVFDWAGDDPACGRVEPTLSKESIVNIFRGGWAPGPHPGSVCGSHPAVTTSHAVKAGYRVVWMPPGSWYLSCYSEKCSAKGDGSGFESWEHVYAQEPFYNEHPKVLITDPAEQARVIGGEVTLWSERLDAAVAMGVAFPRAAAAAERLWSPRAVDLARETAGARPRMQALRCLLLERGIAASTLDGGNEASTWGLPSRPLGPGSDC